VTRSFKPRRASRWWLLLLLATAMLCTLLHPAPVRWRISGVLERAAERRGLAVTYGAIDGTIFDAITIHDVRLRDISKTDSGTDLTIANVEFSPSLSIPFFQRRDAFLESVVLDGVRGQYAFRAQGAPGEATGPVLPARSETVVESRERVVSRWLPARFVVQRADVKLLRGNLALRVAGLRVFGDPGASGFTAARETEFIAAAHSVNLPAWHGINIWQRPKLSLYSIALGNGVNLVSAALDLSGLPLSQIEGDVALDALGGSLRGQITADFSSARNFFDVAGSLQRVAVEPVARLLGGGGPFAGSFDQGQFTFRGDPGDPLSASASLRVEAREFQWKERRFESLAAGATLVNRHVQVQQFELRQSKNLLRLSGESALPQASGSPVVTGWIGQAMAFLQAGFTCTIDARLEDLKALGQLADPGFSEMSGRISVFGRVDGRAEGLDGYLNIEGSGVQVRGMPIDSLTSTVVFKGDELQLTDLQATSGKSDYFTGKATWQPLGSGRYNAELKAQIADLARYAPAYVGELIPGPLAGALWLEWSGDGTRKSHSGAFNGAVEKFSAKRANARGTFARPTDLQIEGTYSPTSLSLRQLVLREGKREVLKADGALPWIQDRHAWTEGRFLDPDRPISLRLEGNDAPLDLAAFFFKDFKQTDGRATGKVEVTGSRLAPRVNGNVKLKGGAVEWSADAPGLATLDGDFSFDAASVKVAGGSGDVMGAAFQFSGSVNWEADARPSVVDLLLKTNEVAWIDDQTMNADAAIDCRVEGPVDALAVSGTVTMVEGARFWRRLVAVDSAQTGDSLPLRAGLLLPATVFGPTGWMGDRKIDLRVIAAKPLRVEAEGFSGEFVPDVRFGGTGREPQVVSGELRLVKTAFTIDRNTTERWDVDSAVFSFASGSAFDANPTLALLASRKLGRSKQTLRLSGSADAASGIDDAPVSVRLR
jgi:TamB, inner membrane protein subunit of TAM complex